MLSNCACSSTDVAALMLELSQQVAGSSSKRFIEAVSALEGDDAGRMLIMLGFSL